MGKFKLTPIQCFSCSMPLSDELKEEVDAYLEKMNADTLPPDDVIELNIDKDLNKIFQKRGIDCPKCKQHLLTDVGIPLQFDK